MLSISSGHRAIYYPPPLGLPCPLLFFGTPLHSYNITMLFSTPYPAFATALLSLSTVGFLAFPFSRRLGTRFAVSDYDGCVSLLWKFSTENRVSFLNRPRSISPFP